MSNTSNAPVAFIVKNKELPKTHFIEIEHGTHNGYVAVPSDHPLFGKQTDYPSIINLKVHGGVTYTESGIYGKTLSSGLINIKPEYVGKINLLIQDGEFLESSGKEFLLNELKENKEWWIIGFDTWHYGDNPYIWNKDAVTAETVNLWLQIKEIAENQK